MPDLQPHELAVNLLAWYDTHHRELLWRVSPRHRAAGISPDPYRVWLSEIMLQQTTVQAVKPYFERFLELWPSVDDLAAAPVDEVMRAWAGLGYYSRARNLHKCAAAVVERHGGVFPAHVAALRELPGIGAYTAAAIASIAFSLPATVVDGNVERVVTRLCAIETPLPQAKPLVAAQVARMVPHEQPGDFAQAMMDLGATICTPRRPRCMLCPLRQACTALVQGDPERFPLKAPKASKPRRVGAAFVAVRGDGAVLLRKRPDKGLLAGMAEVPGSGWTARTDGLPGLEAAPFAADWRVAGTITHVFTHFELELTVYRADVADAADTGDGWWSAADVVAAEALPTVMKKALEAAIPGATKSLRKDRRP